MTWIPSLNKSSDYRTRLNSVAESATLAEIANLKLLETSQRDSVSLSVILPVILCRLTLEEGRGFG